MIDLRIQIRLFALTVLLFGTASIGSGDDILRIGSAQRDITPPTGFPISGYFHERLATETRDPLFAKAIVFQQGETKVIWVVCDLVGITRDLYVEVTRRTMELHDIPVTHLVLSATHSHTAPDYRAHLVRYLRDELRPDEFNHGGKTPYAEHLIQQIVGAIGDAIANRREAKLLAGNATQVTPVSFNRRSVMRDGSVLTWQPESNPERLRAAGPIDDQLGVVAMLDAQNNQPFLVGSSYALHLDTVSGTRWSADYPAYLQRAVEKKYGDQTMSVFAAGTCGDINHVDPAKSDRNSCEFIGGLLAETLIAKVDVLLDESKNEFVSPSPMQFRHAAVPLVLQPVTRTQIKRARALIPRAREGEKIAMMDLVAAHSHMMLDRLRNDPPWVDANDDANSSPMIHWQGVGEKLPVDVSALTFGDDLAIVFLPGEVFVDLGLAIKRHSPFATTLVVELSNCNETAYLPTHAAYAQGSYEVINSRTQPGSGEKLVAAALSLLRESAVYQHRRPPTEAP